MIGIVKFAAVAVTLLGLSFAGSGAYAAEKDIVDTALAAGKFKTLAAALGAAGTVKTLLKPENKAKLTAILTYHVVPGTVMAADVVKLKEAKTVNGAMLAIKIDGSTVMINGAKVTTADIVASNGVIHVIDTVLLPPEK